VFRTRSAKVARTLQDVIFLSHRCTANRVHHIESTWFARSLQKFPRAAVLCTRVAHDHFGICPCPAIPFSVRVEFLPRISSPDLNSLRQCGDRLPLLEDGQTVRDTYEVERFLGEGAFAEVYRVRHRYLGRQALKLFKVAGLTSPEVEEMLGEAVLLSSIDHPNIVRVFDANTVTIEGQVYGYFTMEHVAGGSLDKFWRSYGSQFVPVPVAVDVVKQVCRGLATAHGQDPPIIHRDIKPQNILIGYQSDGLRAKVSDFGLAKRVNPLTLLASARGTRAFKAPEAFDDFNSDSCSGDVWAVGMTLYLLLTDKLPFNVPDEMVSATAKTFEGPVVVPSRVNPTCDSALDRILVRCLAVDRSRRYSTASQLLADLDCWSPKLETGESGCGANEWSTSKEVLGKPSPATPQNANQLAAKAVELAQTPGRLNDAADLMEEAFNKLPKLRSEYQGRVKLWRRGISM
jgi:eukaryotic-like serine/threonine-protein kinase